MEEAVKCFKSKLDVKTYSPPGMKTNTRSTFCARRNISYPSAGIGNMRIRMSEPTLKPAMGNIVFLKIQTVISET